MKYKYYIVDLFNGDVKGTNSDDDALGFSTSQDFYVIDSESGEWLDSKTRIEINNIGK